MINKAWIDHHMGILEKSVFFFGPTAILEPSQSFYEALKVGGVQSLRIACTHLAIHMGLDASLIKPIYTWSITMRPQAAGEVVRGSQRGYEIALPFSIVGDSYAVGAVLAHEISHVFLFERGIKPEGGEIENECFTDLTAVYGGFGKLILNGARVRAAGGSSGQIQLGLFFAS